MKDLLCTEDLRNRIVTNLADFNRHSLPVDKLRQAAVALTIVDYRGEGALPGLPAIDSNSGALILTRRSNGLKKHAGQWALPGGSIDFGESPMHTALRELKEEVGLDLSASDYLGCLDDFVTRSGFHITPVVIWGGLGQNLVKNEQEVASIHRIPCSEFLRGDAPFLEPSAVKDKPIMYMPVGNTCIASPTAALLFQFREVALCGLETRVAHYEQPYFAWS